MAPKGKIDSEMERTTSLLLLWLLLMVLLLLMCRSNNYGSEYEVSDECMEGAWIGVRLVVRRPRYGIA
jgi:hypothetical protein